MDASLVHKIRERAGNVCEYCRLPQSSTDLQLQVDHIIARKHGGKTVSSNLALACVYCNRFKGSNIAGVDPKTGRVTSLFNPRRQKWSRHFSARRAHIVGRTAVGRATVQVLAINHALAVVLRESLMKE